MKIIVIDCAGEFQIVLIDPHGKETRYRFDQEETHRNLVDLFYKLGFTDVTYEEGY